MLQLLPTLVPQIVLSPTANALQPLIVLCVAMEFALMELTRANVLQPVNVHRRPAELPGPLVIATVPLPRLRAMLPLVVTAISVAKRIPLSNPTALFVLVVVIVLVMAVKYRPLAPVIHVLPASAQQLLPFPMLTPFLVVKSQRRLLVLRIYVGLHVNPLLLIETFRIGAVLCEITGVPNALFPTAIESSIALFDVELIRIVVIVRAILLPLMANALLAILIAIFVPQIQSGQQILVVIQLLPLLEKCVPKAANEFFVTAVAFVLIVILCGVQIEIAELPGIINAFIETIVQIVIPSSPTTLLPNATPEAVPCHVSKRVHLDPESA